MARPFVQRALEECGRMVPRLSFASLRERYSCAQNAKGSQRRKGAHIQQKCHYEQVHIRSLRFVFAVAFALALHCAVLAQSSPVAYQVTLDKNPTTTSFTSRFKSTPAARLRSIVAMPAWSPGAYGIRNEWRNVQEFSATDETSARSSSKRLISKPGASTPQAAAANRAIQSLLPELQRRALLHHRAQRLHVRCRQAAVSA